MNPAGSEMKKMKKRKAEEYMGRACVLAAKPADPWVNCGGVRSGFSLHDWVSAGWLEFAARWLIARSQGAPR